jgi:hypothetical protein
MKPTALTLMITLMILRSIYEKYKQLLEFEIAVHTIEKMDEKIEFKDKKIAHLQHKLKGLNQYDELKLINFLIIRPNHRLKQIELNGDRWKL